MTKNLLLVLSAFTSLIAVVTLVDGALIASPQGASRLWMLGVLVVGVLCWLRWRWVWSHALLFPALLVGAAMLLSFAIVGVGESVQISQTDPRGASLPGIMNVLLGLQGILMFYQLWRDRRTRADALSHKDPLDN